ncbi:uncharacterized protein LAESUDRAFT_730689 [Laetiporus sulphureus 93-53]|uniref:Uncharacterized protein n=1 Tax=Laetiporus sulphureus 93-53 TaxID=1314785 RepID=A0A165C0I6_9APHY|nr:uncharacterized protein LAESUDRAFT_730689 [Laetiporus sulphureus 93-53]KZT01978.1 hypothetical protein LAESUDRAFT_730689 [Laetiporus sulphureus 93-53]
MASVSLISANLATICLESLLYGIFLVLTVLLFWLLVQRHRQSSNALPRRLKATCNPLYTQPMFVAGVLLLMSNTLHWVIAVTRLFKAFVDFEGGAQPLAFYGNLSQPTEVIQTGAMVAAVVLGDAMIIYRLWIVWAYNKYIIIPSICTLLGLTVCGIGVTYQLSQFHLGENIFATAAGRWITCNCVFSMITNIYATCMIAWKIWRVNRVASHYSGTNLMNAAAIMVESAFLYTAWNFFFFVAYQSRSNLQFTAVETLPFIAGIAFMLINVRVGLGWAYTADHHSPEDQQNTVFRGPLHRGLDDTTHSMRPLTINVTRTTVRSDSGLKLPDGTMTDTV